MPSDDAFFDVGVATVIDQFRSTSPDSPVHYPVAIHPREICPPSLSSGRIFSATLTFSVDAGSFPRIFDYFPTGGNDLQGKDSEAIDRRTAHAKTEGACAGREARKGLCAASHSKGKTGCVSLRGSLMHDGMFHNTYSNSITSNENESGAIAARRWAKDWVRKQRPLTRYQPKYVEKINIR